MVLMPRDKGSGPFSCHLVTLDDIFIFSQTIEEHEEHLKWVFDKLQEASLYLSRKKVVLSVDSMLVLGHIVD